MNCCRFAARRRVAVSSARACLRGSLRMGSSARAGCARAGGPLRGSCACWPKSGRERAKSRKAGVTGESACPTDVSSCVSATLPRPSETAPRTPPGGTWRGAPDSRRAAPSASGGLPIAELSASRLMVACSAALTPASAIRWMSARSAPAPSLRSRPHPGRMKYVLSASASAFHGLGRARDCRSVRELSRHRRREGVMAPSRAALWSGAAVATSTSSTS